MDSKDIDDRLNWKICFKKILAPHLLNPSINDKQNIKLGTDVLPNNSEIGGISQNDVSWRIMKHSFKTDENMLRFSRDFHDPEFDHTDSNLYNFENPKNTEESIANIIKADAKEISNTLMALEVPKKNKELCTTKRKRIVTDWNSAFQNIFNPKAVTDTSLDVPSLDSCQSQKVDLWISHRLIKEDGQQSEKIELPPQSPRKKGNDKPYTEAEKNVLEVFKLARSFKKKKNPHINIFDGAGVNCFKNEKIKFSKDITAFETAKPINVPPPDGWINAKRFTAEDVMKSQPNIITSEPWDPEEY